jgi:hypothetical protein
MILFTAAPSAHKNGYGAGKVHFFLLEMGVVGFLLFGQKQRTCFQLNCGANVTNATVCQ